MKAPELDNNLRRIFGASEDWDNDGIQIDCGNEIKRAVIALDCTSKVIEYAVSQNAGAVITHHPLIFKPLTDISASDSAGKRVVSCVKNNISVLSYHTCFDIAPGGVNDLLCEALGIKNTYPFLPFGRYGSLAAEMDFAAFVALCEDKLKTKVQNVVNCGKTVKNIAVIAGGGKDYVKEAARTGADTYLTGEVNHAAAIDCEEYRINLVCATHFATENAAMPRLAEKAGQFVPEVLVFES